jgi:hypothetical protein
MLWLSSFRRARAANRLLAYTSARSRGWKTRPPGSKAGRPINACDRPTTGPMAQLLLCPKGGPCARHCIRKGTTWELAGRSTANCINSYCRLCGGRRYRTRHNRLAATPNGAHGVAAQCIRTRTLPGVLASREKSARRPSPLTQERLVRGARWAAEETRGMSAFQPGRAEWSGWTSLARRCCTTRRPTAVSPKAN